MISLRRRVASGLAALILAALTALAVLPSPARAAELIYFSSRTCPYCLAWERQIGIIYSKTPEGRQAPLRRLDIRAPRPADLAHIGEVRFTPTFVLVHGGREVGRIVGYSDEFFWPELQRILARVPADR